MLAHRLSDRQQSALGEDLLCSECRIQGAGKAAVDGGVQERLDDLLRREPDVERSIDVNLELGLAAAKCGEHTERHELSIAGVQAGAQVYLTEAPRDHLMAQFRGDIARARR